MRTIFLLVLVTLNASALCVAAFTFTREPWQALVVLGFALFSIGSAVALARYRPMVRHAATGKW